MLQLVLVVPPPWGDDTKLDDLEDEDGRFRAPLYVEGGGVGGTRLDDEGGGRDSGGGRGGDDDTTAEEYMPVQYTFSRAA